jgi:hypothetical protein
LRKDAVNRGISPPSEEEVRQSCLGPGVEAPDLVKVKDFTRFYIATSRPRIMKKEKKPTVDSINSILEFFFAGFTSITGTETNGEDRSEVYDVSTTHPAAPTMKIRQI